MQIAPTYRTYSRETLAAEAGISPRRLKRWIALGLVPAAHGRNPRWSYYDDTHLRAVRNVLRDVCDHNVTLTEYRERLHESL